MSANECVVFKQSYKPRNVPSSKVLNQKHLVYIATRPGVMCNPGCGFGLWGKLEDNQPIGNIGDLRVAYHRIGEVSKEHTIYRAIISVDRKTALEHDLHNRLEWERLLRSRISVIRHEMNIKESDFRWVASMHYKKNHPHVHILFWDEGVEPREEYMSEERFKEYSENVRKAFSGAILNAEQISEAQREAGATVKETRQQLAVLLKEANIPDALDLDRVAPETQDALGRQLVTLAAQLPDRGALKYDYLPAGYKAMLDSYLEEVLKIGDFKRLNQQYTSLKEDVTRLYGNSESLSESYLEKAHKAFLKELGNETLKYLKTVSRSLRAEEIPEGLKELVAITQPRAQQLLHEFPEYQMLLNSMPTFRTPIPFLVDDPEIRGHVDSLTRMLAQDLRIRSRADALFQSERTEDWTKEEAAETRKEINKTLYRAMRSAVWDAALEDKGYRTQQRAETAIMGLLQTFRALSQSKNHLQSQKVHQLSKYRSLSETAKRDLKKKRQQEGGWTFEP